MPAKPYLNLLLVVVLPVIFWGCAGLQPAFNPKYLASSAPGTPNSKIELTQDVVDIIAMASVPGQTANARVHWVANDKLILSVGVWGTDGHFATYAIKPSSGEIEKLKALDEERILGKINGRIQIESTETTFMKVIRTINQYLFYRGKKTPYAGRIKDGSQQVDIVLKVHTKGSQKSKIKGKIKNIRTGISIPIKWSSNKNGYYHEGSVRGLFLDFRISPDGRYYVIGAAYLGGPYLYDANLKRKCKPDWLIKNYNHHAITVDPLWKHIALLRSANTFMQKDSRYWIEIHDLSVTGLGTSSAAN